MKTPPKIAAGGYTLVEMIISIGLLAMLLIVIVNTAFILSKSRERSQDHIEINSAAMGAFTRFSRDVRRATSIDAVASTLDASGGRIALRMQKEDGTYDVTSFYLSENRVKEDLNGILVGDITPSGTTISNLTFRLFQVATTTALRIEMSVEPKASSTVPALNFYGTYVLRGSYTE